MENSKKIGWALFAVALIFSVDVLVCTAKGLECGNLTTVVLAMWSAFGVYSGFYLYKSKCENKAKYAQKFVKQLADKYGVDAAIQLTEITTRE